MTNTSQKQKPIINPFESLDKITHPTVSSGSSESVSSLFKEIPKVGDNATKINFEKLDNAYANQDKRAIEDIQKDLNPDQLEEANRIRFFKKYKQEEEEYYVRRKQEEEEKKKQEELEEEQRKKREEEEQFARNAEAAIPQGKKRKNIFVKIKDKATTLLPPEMRPGGGKQ